jgi:hypothetical protein
MLGYCEVGGLYVGQEEVENLTEANELRNRCTTHINVSSKIVSDTVTLGV